MKELMKEAVDRYAKDYKSSSSEDELESDNVIGSILKTYSHVGDNNKHQFYILENLIKKNATSGVHRSTILVNEEQWTTAYWFSAPSEEFDLASEVCQ
ncbi:hypothetical protein CBL_11480 [Carabus blaptoides fortunei]